MRTSLPVVLLLTLSIAVAASQSREDWDVTEPFAPTEEVAFETSEGTWMNVDVSPDGQQIVFDLLGDIYVMPVDGGPATRVLGGPAFEMQPRFSPDGERIAFSSDRDGLWNIWTARLDGSDPVQISREREWFVNSPTWAPDGEAIFARRHFVTTRSLGAGEVWMYHASGSGGLAVTERENAQKDVGEPAISPDGRYVYFSKDVTPGSTFEYNKDPNGVIFAVMRHDLQTGEASAFVTRPGGSVTPRPSPDGRYLAFIRRVRLETHLYLKDLETGEEFSIFDRLDKDLQEAWTVHGVYRQIYAWTPDSTDIVIWGEGRIWRVDVAARTGAEIPFAAQVQQTITPAARFTVPVHQDEFPVKMLRDAQVSPDGASVAFNALGHIYVRALDGSGPQQVTPDNDGGFDAPFYLDPAWSPDGSRLVYTTWHDADRGQVMVLDRATGSTRAVTTRAAHYIEPAFSPDGEWIVYRETASDGIRTDSGIPEPGLYVVRADGSAEPRRVRQGGVNPEFDHTGERLYFREQRAQFVLASVDLDGDDERVHFQSANATDIVPSPDGRWVAFQERWHVYVMPFARTGRPVTLGPNVNGMPVTRVSRDAGFFLHWSADSARVHWMLGPEFFTRELSRTFAFLGTAEEVADPEAAGVNIGFTATSDVPTGTTALVGARIITMNADATVIENGTIVIEGNRITAVGPSNQVTVPAGAQRIDATGKTIIPGLIDAHAHVGAEGDGIPARQAWTLLANLAFGVTTMHDPSNDLEMVFANAELIKAGGKLSPRLFSTGRILYGAETAFKAPVQTYEDALSHVRRLKAIGAPSVKSYNQQRRDARQMILRAARELEMNVVPEGGSLYYQNATHVMDGHTTVEHNLPVPNLYHDIISLYAASGVGYTPTLVVAYGASSGENYWYQNTNVWENERLLQFVPRSVVDPRSRRRMMLAEEDYGHVLLAQGAKSLADAGVPVNMGAHGQLQGLGAHWETWMLGQGDMTQMQALQSATMSPARSLGFADEIGSLEVGKLADLVVLDANPLDDLRATEQVFQVMLNGRLFDRELNEVGAASPRPRLWFEGR